MSLMGMCCANELLVSTMPSSEQSPALSLVEFIACSLPWGVVFSMVVSVFVRQSHGCLAFICAVFLTTTCRHCSFFGGRWPCDQLVHIYKNKIHFHAKVIMPFKLNQWNYINPAAETETDTQQQTNTARRNLSHYLPGTERNPYYTCKWCFVQIRNTYFKYLKHRGVCPCMK